MTEKHGWGANELPELSEAREQHGSALRKPISRRAALLMSLFVTGCMVWLGAHEMYGGAAIVLLLFVLIFGRSNGPLPE